LTFPNSCADLPCSQQIPDSLASRARRKTCSCSLQKPLADGRRPAHAGRLTMTKGRSQQPACLRNVPWRGEDDHVTIGRATNLALDGNRNRAATNGPHEGYV